MSEVHPPYLDQNPNHRIAVRDTVEGLLPLLHATRPCERVLDIGCNTGDWLRGFHEVGLPRTKLVGLDVEEMRPHLLIDERCFIPMDISRHLPWMFNDAFDLALCLEVGEHLPESCAEILVGNCMTAADTVLFSAAVPGQGGHGHINEQPEAYWRDKFVERGYTWDNSIRQRLPESLVWWYRRNMALCRRVV